jgi:hypothetical protein
MDAKKRLTGFSVKADSGPSLRAMLDEAGLELWQAPEGFWAIRAKQRAPVPAPPVRRVRRPRTEGHA